MTRSMQPVRRRRLIAVSVAALMALAACGSSDGAATDTSGADAEPTAEAAPVTDAAPAAEAESATSEAAPTTDVALAGTPVLENSPELVTLGDALPQLENGAPDAAVGVAAPVLSGQQFDGTDITIGGEAGGPTMLVFLAHWCPHCNDEIPEMLELRDNGDLPADLNVVGISTAVASDRDNFPPSQWIDEKGWEWPVLADTEASEAFQTYGGNGFPFAVMLDANGNVLARKSGSSDAAQIMSWIDAALPRA